VGRSKAMTAQARTGARLGPLGCAKVLDHEQAHTCAMGGDAGGTGLCGLRRYMPEGEAQGDKVAGEEGRRPVHGAPRRSRERRVRET
jgi:hypothetical protein